jgi:hypothetical protein
MTASRRTLKLSVRRRIRVAFKCLKQLDVVKMSGTLSLWHSNLLAKLIRESAAAPTANRIRLHFDVSFCRYPCSCFRLSQMQGSLGLWNLEGRRRPRLVRVVGQVCLWNVRHMQSIRSWWARRRSQNHCHMCRRHLKPWSL